MSLTDRNVTADVSVVRLFTSETGEGVQSPVSKQEIAFQQLDETPLDHLNLRRATQEETQSEC